MNNRVAPWMVIATSVVLAGCINLDGLFYDGQPLDAYLLPYASTWPQDRRIPDALRPQFK